MQRVTIIAIVAAAAAGIIAAAVLFYPTLYVGGFDRTVNEPDTKQQQNLNMSGVTPSNNSGYKQVNITVNGVKLVADVAATSEQQSLGLGVKDSLNENEAMLFPFKKESQHTFWMKGMKFPIDIIWIDSDKEVVHIEPNLDPCMPNSLCPTYTPDRRSLYVLETVAGFAQKYNITEGTPVEFELDS